MLTRYFSLISIIETAKFHVWRKNTLVRHCTKNTFFKLCFFQILQGLRMAASGCSSGVIRSRSSASGVQETLESPGYDSTTRETRSVHQGHRKGIKTGIYQSSAEYLPALSPGPPYGLTTRCRLHPECW